MNDQQMQNIIPMHISPTKEAVHKNIPIIASIVHIKLEMMNIGVYNVTDINASEVLMMLIVLSFMLI